MKFGIAAIFLVSVLLTSKGPAFAAVSDFAPFFDINLETDKLPTQEDFEKLLVRDDDYNKKYKSFFDLLGDFDREFYLEIAAYGGREKRLRDENEEMFLEFLNMMPKKYYQYIGPMLFEVPNMSEKILNLPGIKETKNKFPARIAEQVKDIEDLEFMSPMYYFLLMPEAWPGYEEEIEQPKTVKYYPKVQHDGKFYEAIRKLVKPEKFMPGYKEEAKKSKSDLRTLRPTKDSLLTSADIKAFISTIDAVDEWANKEQNQFWLSRMTILWTLYDRDDALGKYVPAGIKDLVHPCVRFVQKVKILGKESEVAALIAKEGFTLNEWAYTCDKTIKAHRVANVRSGIVQAIREYAQGIHDDEIEGMSIMTQNGRYAVMQSVIEAHKAPLSDVLEYKKNRQEFTEKLEKHGFHFFGYPITRY